MAILNNLYPPIVDTYAPTFLIDSSALAKNICRVYFSISPYNIAGDIKNVQVTIRDQNTNGSMLNPQLYPCEIMLTSLKQNRERESNDNYFIEIKKEDMINQTFEINTYYKIQLRFTGAAAQEVSLTKPQGISSWLHENLPYFSEWSTICLARGISAPTLSVKGFDSSVEYTIWTTDFIDMVGKITFANPAEQDTLKQYEIQLFNDSEQPLTDKMLFYTSNLTNVNEINYIFEYAFQDGEKYKVRISYTTNLLYSETLEYNFLVLTGSSGKMDATISTITDEENGRIGVHIVSNTPEFYTGNFTIRRTSSETNFTIWEDIHTLTLENQLLDFIWYDCSIVSGVWYKYCVQKRDSFGNRGVVITTPHPTMVIFDNMFLTTSTKQLNIKFNPVISSFKYNVAETKIDTIGSKYPFVKRNGEMYYRQFSISGLVSHFMDENHLFTDEKEIYKENLNLYQDFNEKNQITPYNDYTYEREFRDIVMDFLYDNKVKLFRSPTEGNILVKITDVNFTPNTTLGRMIYSFSCNAYEIDACSIKNFSKYQIQDMGTLDTELEYIDSILGQMQQIVPAHKDVLDILQERYGPSSQETFVNTVQFLDYLKIEIESDPYLIKEGPSGPYPIDDMYPDVDETPQDSYLGHIIYVNDLPIVINPEGIYELAEQNVKVTSLSFPKDTQINLSYNVQVTKKEDKTKVPKIINYNRKVGQLWGSFNYKDAIFTKIWNKYFERYSDYQQTMTALEDVSIEALPNTVIYVTESKELDPERHIIGDTCRLDFTNEYSSVIGLYFAGIHFEEATPYEADRDLIPDYRYIDTYQTVEQLSDIYNPIYNGVYTLKNPVNIFQQVKNTKNKNYENFVPQLADKQFYQKMEKELSNGQYIWHNDQWWLFTASHDLLCPVEGLINYTCEIAKGWYEK